MPAEEPVPMPAPVSDHQGVGDADDPVPTSEDVIQAVADFVDDLVEANDDAGSDLDGV
jgi:hypothetical protein